MGEGAKAIAIALNTNVTLKYLNLKNNKIGDLGAQAFAMALKKNSCLYSLYLDSNVVGDIGIESIVNVMYTNTTLKILRLNGNMYTVNKSAEVTKILCDIQKHRKINIII